MTHATRARLPASMTRILLATLAFYRRWLSPALHSLGSGRLQIRAHLLGVCRGGDRDARPAARHRHWRPGGCCAAIPSRAEGSIRCPPARRQDLFPTNRYHRREQPAGSSALHKRQEVSFARNSQSQSSNARPRRRRQRRRRRHALHDGLHAVAARGLLGYQYFKPKPDEPRRAAQRRPSRRRSDFARRSRGTPVGAASKPAADSAAGRCRRSSSQLPRQPRPRPRSRTSCTRSSSPIAARR